MHEIVFKSKFFIRPISTEFFLFTRVFFAHLPPDVAKSAQNSALHLWTTYTYSSSVRLLLCRIKRIHSTVDGTLMHVSDCNKPAQLKINISFSDHSGSISCTIHQIHPSFVGASEECLLPVFMFCILDIKFAEFNQRLILKTFRSHPSGAFRVCSSCWLCGELPVSWAIPEKAFVLTARGGP